MKKNPHQLRLDYLIRLAEKVRLDAVLISDPANLKALTNITCDHATLLIRLDRGTKPTVKLYTDFRYIPMVHRLAPYLPVGDLRKMKFTGQRIGIEYPTTSLTRLEELYKDHPKADFIDFSKGPLSLRALKSPAERELIAQAEELNCRIFNWATKRFKPGMTERDMARVIQHLMLDHGEGEAFETIVCVGKNAAECHHVPDQTVWTGAQPVLIDMGVKLNGYCSDLTRNIIPPRPTALYRKIYDIVLHANEEAIAAARPGMTAGELDAIARNIITKAGYGKAFGHSLGHGVGIEIHEQPTARKGDTTELVPGMVVTIEPGIYLEGKLGVRIEDLILITDTGCECLSTSAPK